MGASSPAALAWGDICVAGLENSPVYLMMLKRELLGHAASFKMGLFSPVTGREQSSSQKSRAKQNPT